MNNLFMDEGGEYDSWERRLNRIMSGVSRGKWDALVEFQREVKAGTYGSAKERLLSRVQFCFDELRAESDAFNERSRASYDRLSSRLLGFISEVRAYSADEVGSVFNTFKMLQEDVKQSELNKNHRIELESLLNRAFTAWTDLKDKVQEAEDEKNRAEKEAFMNRLEQIEGEKFSRLELPNIEYEIPVRRTRSIPLPTTETSLNPLMEIYPHVFHFSPHVHKETECRIPQVQYAVMCFEAVQSGSDAVLEGPTGLGKTRALLAGAIPWLLQDPDRKMLYATRTVTQVNSVMQDLHDLLTDPVKKEKLGCLTASLHIGTSRIIHDLIKCYKKKPDFDEVNASRDSRGLAPFTTVYCNDGCERFALRWPGSAGLTRPPLDVSQYPVVDLPLLRKQQESCPLRIMADGNVNSRILVIPHNYLYDSFWRSEYLPNPEQTLVVVDEAHNFLHDAGGNAYLTIGLRSPEQTYMDSAADTDNDVDEVEVGVKTKQTMPDNRSSNEYYIGDMLRKAESIFGRGPCGNPEFGGANLRECVHYLVNLYDELSDCIAECETDENRAQSYYDESGNALDIYVIQSECMFALASKLRSNFLANLSRLRNWLELAKEHILTVEDPTRRWLEAGIYSYSQLVSSLIEIIRNPYEFVLTSSGGTFTFNNLHPGRNAARAMEGFHSRIFTSATLSPTVDVAYLLGTPDALRFKISPVFPKKNYRSFFVVGVNSASKEDLSRSGSSFTSKEMKVLADLFTHALGAAKGRNIGVFCSSNQVVSEIYYLIQAMNQSGELVLLPFMRLSGHFNGAEAIRDFRDNYAAVYKGPLQHTKQRVMQQQVPEALLNTSSHYSDTSVINAFMLFGHDPAVTAVLIGVAGGTLSEGIDYHGNAMEMVITVGLPYPSSAAEIRLNNAKQDYFFMKRGDRQMGEDLAYRQDALRKTAQSIGRAHRSMEDRAVVICADERLLALKNIASEGDGRYEFLSIANARKNLKLLQEQVAVISQNVVFPGHNVAEERDLMKYLSSGICGQGDFISFATMAEQIKRFYAEQ